uniref:Uncharacterized protein n=1 Tax=Anguilla anguilla TaxID=7936 RepID=A0A0E9UTS6_ANGAN
MLQWRLCLRGICAVKLMCFVGADVQVLLIVSTPSTLNS